MAVADLITWNPQSEDVAAAYRDFVANEQLANALADDLQPESEIRRQLIARAVVLVIDERSRPQAHRFGSGSGSFWTTNDQGKVVREEPWSYPAEFFAQWLRDEVREAATAIVMDWPYPPDADSDALEMRTSGRQLSNHVSLDDEGEEVIRDTECADVLAVLLEESEEVRRDGEEARLLRLIDERATPRQRELLGLLSEGLNISEAGRKLGISPSTARVQMKLLRDNLS